MPAVSAKQQRFMGMIAHNPGMAKERGIPMKVAEEFSHKPKGGYKGKKKHKKVELHEHLMKR